MVFICFRNFGINLVLNSMLNKPQMKKSLIIGMFLFVFQFTFAQIEETQMEEMVIERISKKNIADIIKNVKRQTYNNYTGSTQKYFIRQEAFMNDGDTLVDSNFLYNVSIDLKQKKINKTQAQSSKNKEKLNNDFFARYPGTNDSPLYWLTEIVLRKYVNIPELDFFNNLGDYHFDRKVKGKITTIHFMSDEFYEGFFSYDEKYNLQKIQFRLNEPYPIDHSQSKNGKAMFVKNWKYKVEQVTIEFGLDANQKLYIKDLKASEEIIDYNFIRYDSKGQIIVRDDNLRFKSVLDFEKQ